MALSVIDTELYYADYKKNPAKALERILNGRGVIVQTEFGRYIRQGLYLPVRIYYKTTDLDKYTIYMVSDIKQDAIDNTLCRTEIGDETVSFRSHKIPARTCLRIRRLVLGDVFAREVKIPLVSECFPGKVPPFPEVIPIDKDGNPSPKATLAKPVWDPKIIRQSFQNELDRSSWRGREIKEVDQIPTDPSPKIAYLTTGKSLKTLSNGVVLVAPIRMPDQFLFIPSMDYSFSEEDIANLQGFFKSEAVQYHNWFTWLSGMK